MSLFNVRLPKETEALLSAEAASRQCSKSDIAREAITTYLTRRTVLDFTASDMEDDWAELGTEVLEAQRKVFDRVITKLFEAEWSEVVEPLYQVFRKKVIQKTSAYENPAIFGKDPKDPIVSAAIGFAADDVFEIKMPLDQLLYNYCHSAGDEAFNEIPKIWANVKARIDAEDEGVRQKGAT